MLGLPDATLMVMEQSLYELYMVIWVFSPVETLIVPAGWNVAGSCACAAEAASKAIARTVNWFFMFPPIEPLP
jgi:hypothetical protein